MSTFLNIDLEGKTPLRFIERHLEFSLLWVLSIAIIFFRVDQYFLIGNTNLFWLGNLLPFLLALFLIIYVIVSKWYGVAFLLYPLLAVFWFIPKTVLRRGKIYLLGHYINSVFRKIINPKLFLVHLCLLITPLILLATVDNIYIHWLSILAFSYFYIRYIGNYISRSFKPAQLFGANLETTLGRIVSTDNNNKSTIIESFVNQKTDEKLPAKEREKKRLTRLVLANHTLNFVSKNLNSYKGKRAYLVAWIYELFAFLAISIGYFWFINFQIFIIEPNNFITTEIPSKFEFFYYTFKTITFGDIPTIIPNTITSKVIEIMSFLVLGVFLLVIAASIFFSFRQDKMKENIDLTTKICENENKLIIDYMNSEFKTDVKGAMSEIKNIKDSMDSLQRILKNIF